MKIFDDDDDDDAFYVTDSHCQGLDLRQQDFLWECCAVIASTYVVHNGLAEDS